MKILLGEDDPEMRQMVADALRGDGYEVVARGDGGEVLAQLGSDGQDYGLLLCDIRMPACSGLQVLGTIRRARIEMPVILMTAFGDLDLRRRIEDQGAFLFDKPFDLDDLRTAVAHVARGFSPRAQPTGLHLLATRQSGLDAWAMKWMLEASDISAVLAPDGPRTSVYVLRSDAARAHVVVESMDVDEGPVDAG